MGAEIRKSSGGAEFGMPMRRPSAAVESVVDYVSLGFRDEGWVRSVPGGVAILWTAFKE